MGYQAGYALSTGSDNLLLGFRSGDSLTTGSRNIIIGYDQDAPAPTTSNHLNIGGLIFGDLAAGKVGIGTANPTSTLDVRGGIAVTGQVTNNVPGFTPYTNGTWVKIASRGTFLVSWYLDHSGLGGQNGSAIVTCDASRFADCSSAQLTSLKEGAGDANPVFDQCTKHNMTEGVCIQFNGGTSYEAGGLGVLQF